MNVLPDLPVLKIADEVASALHNGNVLLSAEPGAGKSTVLPLALLLNANLGGRILLLEPRRLAARSVAERMAYLLGEKPGQRIGWRMRGETRASLDTQLEVVTEGVLTRLLQDDPSLPGVALVIFDEFHERSLHADFGLSLCLEVQRELRNDLRILLMSATLETQSLKNYMVGIQEFHCRVRQYDVDVIWVGDHSDPLPQRIVKVVLDALSCHTGDVLVFLPGVAEINRTASLLEAKLEQHIHLHKLHGGVGMAVQVKATTGSAEGGRRVILSTSIAETSITVTGVRVVVDAGLERRGRLDKVTGAQLLETVTANQASATQRAGRAGRTTNGVCYRLWSESDHSRRPLHWQPEILRADLAPLLLELALWGVSSADELSWLDPPASGSLSRAQALIEQLGLWSNGTLTPHGKIVASLPVHPRLGHMLVWATQRGMHAQASALAVWLEERQRPSDAADIEPLLSKSLSSLQKNRMNQLIRLLKSSVSASAFVCKRSLPSPSLAVVLAQAYPDWVAQRRQAESGSYRLACGAGAVLDDQDPLSASQWLIAGQLGGGGKLARIFKALALDIDELQLHAPEHFAKVDQVIWDMDAQRVIAEHQLLLGSLVVSSKPLQNVSNIDKAQGLTEGIRKNGIQCLPWTDRCRDWQARVQRLLELLSTEELCHWPQVDDSSLTDQLDVWLQPWVQGIGSLRALQKIDLYAALLNLLNYQQKVQLDDWFPENYVVPSGSRIRLRYTEPGNPVLSVKVQEMLGCSENPTLALGQVPIKIELLSPARRPVQVTEDLANFWTNSYPAVKKEMAGRYPKHDWPDNPLTARPTSQAKRRKT